MMVTDFWYRIKCRCKLCNKVDNITLSGLANGNQRFKCKNCSLSNKTDYFFTVPYDSKEAENYFVVKGVQMYLEGFSLGDIHKMVHIGEDFLIERINPIKPFLDSYRFNLSQEEIAEMLTDTKKFMAGIKPNVLHSIMFKGVPMEFTEIRGVSRLWLRKNMKKPRDIENYFFVKALQLYVEGMPIREISKILKVSHDVLGNKLSSIKRLLEDIRLTLSKIEWIEVLQDARTIILDKRETKIEMKLSSIPFGYHETWGVRRVRHERPKKRGRKKKQIIKEKVDTRKGPYSNPNKNVRWHRYWNKSEEPF
jgi:transposase-like protein